MTRPQPSLANAELAIMDLLWDADAPLTARTIRERLYPDESAPSQHGTVQRLLQRLEDKGVIARDRDQPVHLFSPRLTRDDYASSQLETLADKLTGGSIAPLITTLVAHNKLSQRDLDALRALLNDAEDPR